MKPQVGDRCKIAEARRLRNKSASHGQVPVQMSLMVSASDSSFFRAASQSISRGIAATINAFLPAPTRIMMESSLSTTTPIGVLALSSELAVQAAPSRVAHMMPKVSPDTSSGMSPAMIRPSRLTIADANAPNSSLSARSAGLSSVSIPSYRLDFENTLFVPSARALDLFAVHALPELALVHLAYHAPQPVTSGLPQRA